MKIANIVPTAYLDLIEDRPVHMALAHLALDSTEYAEWYHEQAERGSFVILDNSLIELGQALPMHDLLRAAELCGATEVILPDVFKDSRGTVASVKKALTEIDQLEDIIPRGIATSLMCVVHGADREDWIECYDELARSVLSESISTFGIPKVLDEVWSPGGRIGCTTFLQQSGRINPRKAYHLLGIWTDPIEVRMQSIHPWIRSLDTALPFHAGQHGLRFTSTGLPRGVRPKRPHRFFEMPRNLDSHSITSVKFNINVLDKWSL